MKNFSFAILAFAVLFSFTSCEKADEKIHNVYFYTSNQPSSTINQKSEVASNLELYVDGQYRGNLSYLNFRPNCDTDSLASKTVYLSLKSGSYKVEARDAQGNVKSSSKLKITDSGLSSAGGTGGVEASANQQSSNMDCFFNECVIVNLFY